MGIRALKFWIACTKILVCLVASIVVVYAAWRTWWGTPLFLLGLVLAVIPLVIGKRVFDRSDADPFDID